MNIISSVLCGCFPCCGRNSSVLINGQHYAIQRLLGEGGFSFVYLVQSRENNDLFALKKIHCPFGNIESVSEAMREVNSYKKFRSPYITHCVSSQVLQEQDGSKTVFILLPYFPTGSLLDKINTHLLDGTTISEEEIVRILVSVARGLRTMHNPAGQEDSIEDQTSVNTDLQYRDTVSMTYNEDLRLLNDSLELDVLSGNTSSFMASTTAYSHKDIKPANIMFSSDGLPVICDLGSCSRAHVDISSRSQLVEFQEWCNEHCTLPFRSPELLNVTLNSKIDEKVDIWSLGCTLYCMCFGISPFEREEQLSGASMTYAIATGKFSIPPNTNYSPELIKIIKDCIEVDSKKRPSIDELLARLQDLQGS